MSSRDNHAPRENPSPPKNRDIEVVRKEYGWSIKISHDDPETRHQPLTKEERTKVRDDVKKGEAGTADLR
jgi:hypothetical protein